jgi:hypothetical protein
LLFLGKFSLNLILLRFCLFSKLFRLFLLSQASSAVKTLLENFVELLLLLLLVFV